MIGDKGLINKTNSGLIKWDTEAEVPITCDKCLGNNPFVKMIKCDYDKECKFCKRPYTVFNWRLDSSNRFYSTEICTLCARVKNVCQCCILDLKFGMEMEARDRFLKKKIEMPKDLTNRDFWAYKMSKKIDSLELPYDNPDNYLIGIDESKGKEEIEDLEEINQEKDEYKIPKVEESEIVPKKIQLKLKYNTNYAENVIYDYKVKDDTNNVILKELSHPEKNKAIIKNNDSIVKKAKPEKISDKLEKLNKSVFDETSEFKIEEFDDDYKQYYKFLNEN